MQLSFVVYGVDKSERINGDLLNEFGMNKVFYFFGTFPF